MLPNTEKVEKRGAAEFFLAKVQGGESLANLCKCLIVFPNPSRL